MSQRISLLTQRTALFLHPLRPSPPSFPFRPPLCPSFLSSFCFPLPLPPTNSTLSTDVLILLSERRYPGRDITNPSTPFLLVIVDTALARSSANDRAHIIPQVELGKERYTDASVIGVRPISPCPRSPAKRFSPEAHTWARHFYLELYPRYVRAIPDARPPRSYR